MRTYLSRNYFVAARARAPRTMVARTRGIGLTEVMVVMVIVGVLFAILMPVVAKVRRSSRSVVCASNLREIGGAFQSYAMHQQGRLPDPGISDKAWEQILLPYYSGKFQCPGDCELYPAVGSSYDWRDTGNAATTMAGKLLVDTRRADAVLAFESLPGWHAKGYINVVRLDGSVQTVQAEDCFKDLETPVREAATDARGTAARSSRKK